jgi:hypothetical protein
LPLATWWCSSPAGTRGGNEDTELLVKAGVNIGIETDENVPFGVRLSVADS